LAEQIRLVLTVDKAVKEIIEKTAEEFTQGNISAYIRGLALFHQLLLGRSTGHADIPGWLFGHYPMAVIAEMSDLLEQAKLGEGQEMGHDRPGVVPPTKPPAKPHKK
jgi:hypothetical protein